MQFKIPQNVQQEDKIVGPLTLKQLIIVGAGGGIDYFLYVSLARVYVLQVWVGPVVIIALITLAIAFLKIKGIAFSQYIFLSLEFYFKPRKRVWNQGAGEVFISVTQPSQTEGKVVKKKKLDEKDISQISDLTKMLEEQRAILGSLSEEEEEKKEGLNQLIAHP